MAVRTPLYYLAGPTVEPYKQVYPFDATMMSQLHQLAGYAFASSPNPRIEINGTNGSLIDGGTFTDTWISAGSYTTRVDRFSTEAETPNVFQVTDNYARIRVVYDAVTLPTGDTNNTQYPLYLYSPDGTDANTHFRAMTVTDFVDTFVLPTLTQFGGGGSTLAKGGTYYLTTSAAPANGTLTSATPAAVNQEANIAAYAASQIPETPTSNNIVTNYYVAKVDWSPTAVGLWDTGALYDLPLYFDAGTESIKQHSPATWAALLNPFLRFYLGGGSPQHTLRYNVDGADGVTNGTVFTDTRVVPTGTGFNIRYVNTNDYRTQEFPTGSAVVISQKAFKIYQGIPSVTETVSLEGNTLLPETNGLPPTSDGSVNSGWIFSSTGTVSHYNSDVGSSTTGHINWCNITPTGTWYIRVSTYDQLGSQTIPGTGGLGMNTWYDLTAGDRQFTFNDNRPAINYADAWVTFKVEISRNNNGTNIAATGYYRFQYAGLA